MKLKWNDELLRKIPITIYVNLCPDLTWAPARFDCGCYDEMAALPNGAAERASLAAPSNGTTNGTVTVTPVVNSTGTTTTSSSTTTTTTPATGSTTTGSTTGTTTNTGTKDVVNNGTGKAVVVESGAKNGTAKAA